MRVCKELGYQPNLTAQALANARTFIIGAMFINISNPDINDFVETGEGIAREAGFHVILCNSRGDAERERNECLMLRQRGVEGLIVEHVGPVEHLVELDRDGFPLVLTGRNDKAPWLHYVGFDEVAGMYAATQTMIQSGRRNLVYLGYQPGSPACDDRRNGFRKSLQEAGIAETPDTVIPVKNGVSVAEGRAVVRRLLESPNRPDGIVCYTDYLAAGAYQAAMELHLRVPEDIAIMGYGDLPFGLMGEAPFPSVHLDLRRMGTEAATLLLNKIEKKLDADELKSIFIQPFVVRGELLGNMSRS